MRLRPGRKHWPANRGRARCWQAARSTRPWPLWATSLISSRRASSDTRAGVAVLAMNAARRCNFDMADVTMIRRAALIHDIGRVAVPARIWQQPGPLSPDDWEKVRLHPYQTERILHRSPFLAGSPQSPVRTTSAATARVITGDSCSGADRSGPPACRGGCLSDEDRTQTAPGAAHSGAGRRDAHQRGPCRTARCRRRQGGP